MNHFTEEMMKRTLKILGLALVAVLALTAVGASAALAANYTASSYPTTNTAESALGNDVFTTEAGKFECKAHFQSTANGAASSITVTPTYTECKGFGFLSATVAMNGCDFVMASPTGSGDNWSAGSTLSCSGGKIKVTAGTCVVEIGGQTPGGSTALTNNTAAGDMSVKANVTGIAYTVTQDGFGCPFNGTGAKTGATYTQGTAITMDSTNGATIDVG